jgi:Matrixin
LSKNKTFVAGVLGIWLGFAAQVTAGAEEEPQSNWTSADEPCAKYDDMRRPVLGNIGVKIDANGPWADEFRKALSFWNTVLVANFHEETNLSACAIRIINGGPDLLNDGIVARSQLTWRDNFRGEIAVSPKAATAMSSDEMYGAAVHELGHMLGLKHNASSRSVMYFLNVNGTEVLDGKDILDLSSHHKLCANSGQLAQTSVRVPPLSQVETLRPASGVWMVTCVMRYLSSG